VSRHDVLEDPQPPPELDNADLEDILAAYTINPILLQKIFGRIAYLRASIAAQLSAAGAARESKSDNVTPRSGRDRKAKKASADTPTRIRRTKSMGDGLRSFARAFSSSVSSTGHELKMRPNRVLLAEIDRLVASVCPGEGGGPLDKLNAADKALAQQHELAEYVSSTPNYQPISLGPNVVQKLAKILRLLEQKGRNVITDDAAPSADGVAAVAETEIEEIIAADVITSAEYDELKECAKDWIRGLMPGFDVEFLGGRNGVVVKFTPLRTNPEANPFVMNLIVLQKDLIDRRQTCLDARMNLFMKMRERLVAAGARIFAEPPRDTLFSRLAVPYYATRVPLSQLDDSAAASADPYRQVNLSDLCLDGVLVLQGCEFVPDGNMADRYRDMHAKANARRINEAREMRKSIARQAIHDAVDWASTFGLLISNGFLYTDVKPQNLLAKLSDIKSFVEFDGDAREGFKLHAMDVSSTYSDRRVDARCYKPELALKIAIIAILHHCIVGKPPEYDHASGELKFEWSHYLFASDQFEVGGESLGDFLEKFYGKVDGKGDEADQVDDNFAAFFAGLTAFDDKYNPSVVAPAAGDPVPGAAPAAYL